MKKLLISFCVVLAVLMSMPFILGFLLQKDIEVPFQVMKRFYPQSAFEIKDIKNGWFTSSAKLKLTSIPESSAKSMGLKGAIVDEVDINFSHGPIALYLKDNATSLYYGRGTASYELDFGKQLITLLTLVLGKEKMVRDIDIDELPKHKAQLFVDFSGKVHESITFSKTQFKIANIFTVIFNGYEAISDYQDVYNLVSKFTMGEVIIEKKDLRVNVSPINGLMKREGSEGTFDFSLDFQVPKIGIGKDNSTIFKLNNFKCYFDVKAEEYIASTIKVSFNKISIFDEKYGLFSLTLSVEKLDKEASFAIHRANLALQGKDTKSNEFKLALLSLAAQMPLLISHGPTLKIKPFSMVTPHGTASLEGIISVDKKPGQARISIADLTKQFRANITVELPEYYAKEMAFEYARRQLINTKAKSLNTDKAFTKNNIEVVAKGILNQFIEMGYIQRVGSVYKTKIQVQNGNVKINDKALPIP